MSLTRRDLLTKLALFLGFLGASTAFGNEKTDLPKEPQSSNNIPQSMEEKLENIVEIKTEEEFTQYLPGGRLHDKDKALLLDFYADYCVQCKEIEPEIRNIARMYKDKLVVLRFDVCVDKKTSKVICKEPYNLLLRYPLTNRDGKVIKDFYGSLPAIVVLNSNGEVVRNADGLSGWYAMLDSQTGENKIRFNGDYIRSFVDRAIER